jgi:ribulose 1,5-bisphosphate synthetase/thiazole synthase
MNYIEETKEIPCLYDVDVLVCGGGPAGIGAAIRAAREGVSVMVIEMQDCLGGIATAGMMSHWGGRSSSKVMQEIFELTYNKAQDVGWCKDNWCGPDAIYHEVQKIVLEEMFQKEQP